MGRLETLKVKLFADGANFDAIARLSADPLIKGFTTNPTLIRQAGVADYEAFGRKVLKAVGGRPVSLEVFADEFEEMVRQARVIAGWGPNVNVKIPVTNTRRDFAGRAIRQLADEGVVVNVTALLTLDQVAQVLECLSPSTPALISVFAGRIADTGVDPVPIMAEAVKRIADARPRAELIWASPRELLNIFQADAVGCHIITLTSDILAKLGMIGKDLAAYSLETVEMFRRDALAAGYKIAAASPRRAAAPANAETAAVTANSTG